jgi:site-specific recombinase XerD
LKRRVLGQREAGISTRSINTRITGVKAYPRWRGDSCCPQKLKCTNKVLLVFTSTQIKAILGCKPKSDTGKRLLILVQLILDTGLRIDEALTLKWESVDFDNLVVKVRGKGDKERIIPFSVDFRKIIEDVPPIVES